MDFKELESKVVKNAENYEKEFNVKIDQDFALLKLFEEAGEFAQAVLIHQKKCRPEKFLEESDSKDEVAKELADVVGMAMVNAKLLGIDLEDALIKKWVTKEYLKK